MVHFGVNYSTKSLTVHQSATENSYQNSGT